MAEKTTSQLAGANKNTTLGQLNDAMLRGKLDSAARIKEVLDLVIPALEEARHVPIAVTLPANNWNDRVQTVRHDSLKADSKYQYLVCGDADNFGAWTEAYIYADNITVNGEITFHCMATPSADLAVNIIRLEVETEDEQP